MPRTAVVVLWMSLLAIPATAADRNQKSTLLSVDLSKGVIVDATRKQETPLLDENVFTIKRNETTAVQIDRQNPLMFVYEATNEKTDTEEFKAALEFAKQLKVFLNLFQAPLGAGVAKPSVKGLEPESFREDLTALFTVIDALPADLAASLGTPEQIAELKKKYASANLVALGARLDRGYAALSAVAQACLTGNGQIETDAGESILCDGPALLNENVQFTIAVRRAQDAAEAATRAHALVADAKRRLTGLKGASDRAAALKEIAKLEAASVTADNKAKTKLAEVQTRRDAPSARPTLAGFVQLALSLGDRVQRHLTTLRGVSADVTVLDTPLRLISAPYSLQRQTVTVEVKAATKYEALLDGPTRQKRDKALRKFTIVLEPYQPAHLSLAPAVVIGFVRNPEFTAVKKGDSFVIQQTQSDLTRYTLGAMLNITPDAWQEPTFGGHFQVGITPTKDQFAFYFGAGIRAQRLFTFGGGLMIQQVRRLSGGLTLDSKLSDPGDLKTETYFKPGLYLHATVDIPK